MHNALILGAFEMPTGIGRGAERVLSGSLEVSAHDRWTIAMVDEVAWGIGWGDAGDEAPPPCDVLPPTRSRSRVRPAPVPENEVADEAGTSSAIAIPRSSTSRSRSSRSRSRLAAYHPYSQLHGPSHRGIDASEWGGIQRSISGSTGSDCLSPIDQPEIRTPSSSLDRKFGPRTRPARSSSGSQSPPETLMTPVDAVMRDRGRKPLPRTLRTTLTDMPDSPVSPEDQPRDMLSSPLDSDGPPGTCGFSPRSISMERTACFAAKDGQPEDERQKRDVSTPAHTRLSRLWPTPSENQLGFVPAPPGNQQTSPRSRSVDFAYRFSTM